MIGGNVRAALNGRLRGSGCRVLGPTLKIRVDNHIHYPDAFVVCGTADLKSTVIDNPVVVFEVLSVSTARTDMIRKLGEYAATPSIRRYVILQPDFIGGLNLTRNGDHFIAHPLDQDSILAMPEIGIEVPVAGFYEGLDYPPVSDEDDDAR